MVPIAFRGHKASFRRIRSPTLGPTGQWMGRPANVTAAAPSAFGGDVAPYSSPDPYLAFSASCWMLMRRSLADPRAGKVEAEANLDVLLREVVLVDQDLADLVGGIGILAFFGVVVLEQELAVAVLDDRLGVGLDFVHDAEDLGDLGVERRLGAEEDVAVGVGGVVAVVHQLGVGADLAVVAGDELEEAQDAALVHGAEDEGRGRVEQALLNVLAEADQALREIPRLGLPDLPDIEVDEAHREHVVGEEGELVFAVGVVRLEGVPQELDVFLLLRVLKESGR